MSECKVLVGESNDLTDLILEYTLLFGTASFTEEKERDWSKTHADLWEYQLYTLTKKTKNQNSHRIVLKNCLMMSWTRSKGQTIISQRYIIISVP